MATALTLTGVEPGGGRGLEPGLDVGEAVAPGEVGEGLGVDGVEADVDPVEPRVGEALGDALEADAVGRHGDARPRLEGGDAGDELDE